MTRLRLILPLAGLTVVAATVVALGDAGRGSGPTVAVAGGDPAAGKRAIQAYDCTSCHVIPGVVAPTGRAGPSLADLSGRRSIAGDHPNRLEVLVRWIRNPQSLEPGTLMPNLGVGEQEARDIAAYLYGDP